MATAARSEKVVCLFENELVRSSVYNRREVLRAHSLILVIAEGGSVRTDEEEVYEQPKLHFSFPFYIPCISEWNAK